MATIKSYTSIEQSKKLAEILPLESADMWHHGFFHPRRMCKIEYNPPAPYHSVTAQWDCPCWSLAALLSVLPEINGIPLTLEKVKAEDGYEGYYYHIEYKDIVLIPYSKNPVDACYEMILKLHKLNLL